MQTERHNQHRKMIAKVFFFLLSVKLSQYCDTILQLSNLLTFILFASFANLAQSKT